MIGLLLIAIALLAAIWLPGFLKDTARSRLQASPSRYISAVGKWTSHDKGIINTYTRATSIEFANFSDFDVSEIAGKVTYLNSDGGEMAVVPFQSATELRAHTKAMIGVSAGEISGGAHTVRVQVESVRVLN